MKPSDITLVFIDHEPYSKNRAHLFCVNELIEKGFKILWFDISQFLYPGLHVADEIDVEYLQRLNNFSQLEAIVNDLDPKKTLCFLEIFEDLNTFKIFELFDRNKLTRLRFERFGGSDLYKGEKRTLNDFIKIFTWKRAINHLKFIRDSKKLEQVRQQENLEYYNCYINSSSISQCDIRVNHPDYDNYLLKDKTLNRIVDGKYAVFIDVSFGVHPDVIYFSKRKYKKNSNEIWRNKLNTFFEYVEKKYGVEVVIASHPKTNYKPEDFKGRKIIKYETLNLVKHAEFVLMDFSAAFSYCVIYNKKIGIITTKEFYKEFASPLEILTRKMKLNLFRIDKDSYENFEPKYLDKEIRNKYLYSFLTSPETESKTSAEILKEKLPELL